MTHKKESVVVISAPSGTGKTTINRRLVETIDDLEFSISHTTRAIRKGEIDGDHYWFVHADQFQKLIKTNAMIEWASVFGNLYGTSFQEIDRITAKGHRALLEIDVQGWEQIKLKMPGALSIFILPPSMKILWDRLQKRGTDDFQVRWHRFLTAREELDHCAHYQYFVINDDLETTFNSILRFLQHRKAMPLSFEQGLAHGRSLIEEFEAADWIKDLRKRKGSEP